ncbi:hypothetical protein ABW19_dt0204122 [Dactylella cylindrospora]|nr:hypothetical protein ABW19_dt0204122 [Dactylella cylindrospora]
MKFFSTFILYALPALNLCLQVTAAPTAGSAEVAPLRRRRHGPLAIPSEKEREKELDDYFNEHYDVLPDGRWRRKNTTAIESRSLEKRFATIKPGDECRIVAQHDHIIAGGCSQGECDDESFEDSHKRLQDHNNGNRQFAHWGEIDNGKWVWLPLSGKEPIFFGAYWGFFKPYGFDWATYGIKNKEKNMLKAPYCWTEKKLGFQAYIGRVSCSFWCDELNY